MTTALLIMTVLLPLALAPLAATRRGQWLPAAAPLPALAAALVLPSGVAVDLPWLLLGTRLELDETGRWFLAAGAVMWLAAALVARGTVCRETRDGRFRLFFVLAMAGNIWLTIADDIAGFYLGFALMGLSGYGLVAHRATPAARGAGRLYLGWTIAGEVALFSALAMLASASGTLDLAALGSHTPPPAAVALLVLGFGIKLALPGLHVWLPLAYGAAPGAGAAVLSGPMISAGLVGWLRFLPPGDPALVPWGEALMVVGLAGAFYGVAMGLPQRDPRVVLGYSSIAKMGLLSAGFGTALAVPASAGPLVAALVLYGVHHLLVKGALFLGLDLLGTERWRAAVKGGLLFLALALAGAPFTSGALAKATLGDALPASAAWIIPWLGAAAVASVLLMGRFIQLVLAGFRPREEAAPASAIAAWAGLLTLVAMLPFTLAPAPDLAGGWLTLAGGTVVVLLAVTVWPRRWPPPLADIPPGDILHLGAHLRARPHPAVARSAPPAVTRAPTDEPVPAAPPNDDATTGRPLIHPWSGALWLAVGGLVYLAVTQPG